MRPTCPQCGGYGTLSGSHGDPDRVCYHCGGLGDIPSKITEEQVAKAMEAIKAIQADRKDAMGNDYVTLASKCVVCKGPLTRVDGWEYRGDPMHMIIGPGSKNQMSRTQAIYCPKCGLSYHHEPKE